jgi:membrane fusion protein, heavy metal efflux system
MKLNWKAVLAIVVIVGCATGVTLNEKTRGQVVHAWKQMTTHAEEAPVDKSWTEAGKSKEAWDRTVSMTQDQLEAIGLQTVPVHTQTDPTNLALFGITDYDPATVTTVRLQFDSRVDKVLVDLGTVIRKDDPLLELFSTDLASAKSDYEAAVSQWLHDKKILDYKTPLIKDNTLPKKDQIEVENDEAQSALKMKLAKDKLLVYGLNNDEIEAAKKEDGKEKAKMILRARADGVVVKRDVVPGNYYDSKDTLLTIAPLDHLWVRGNVSELDADKVEVNQKITVVFPFSHREIESKVDYIDKAIDPDTRSAKFRATIPNPGGKVKAGAFVKVQVHVPPGPGRTVIPRSAMVSVDRTDYVFIRKPGKVATFERRPIIAATESNDFVVVAEAAEGHRELTPGEQVVTLGSLILEQMFEDKLMAEGGLLVSDPAHEKGDHSGQNVVIRTVH